MDFLSNHQEKVQGLRDQKEALVILDHYTKWLQVYPLSGRTTTQVMMCVKKFLGDVSGDRCHCDRAPEFKRALDRLGIVAVLSNPGKPQSNGLIESYVGKVIRGTRALLSASGLPEPFWPMASQSFCFWP